VGGAPVLAAGGETNSKQQEVRPISSHLFIFFIILAVTHWIGIKEKSKGRRGREGGRDLFFS
jgi:hypothetical protein